MFLQKRESKASWNWRIGFQLSSVQRRPFEINGSKLVLPVNFSEMALILDTTHGSSKTKGKWYLHTSLFQFLVSPWNSNSWKTHAWTGIFIVFLNSSILFIICWNPLVFFKLGNYKGAFNAVWSLNEKEKGESFVHKSTWLLLSVNTTGNKFVPSIASF